LHDYWLLNGFRSQEGVADVVGIITLNGGESKRFSSISMVFFTVNMEKLPDKFAQKAKRVNAYPYQVAMGHT
jgi:hypothetical protein